jgi:hypothetical protein
MDRGKANGKEKRGKQKDDKRQRFLIQYARRGSTMQKEAGLITASSR